MPRLDGTGPMGMGPMTGRGMGYCAGYAAPGYANPMGGYGRGFGYGMGFGRGRGFGRMFWRAGWPGYGAVPVYYGADEPAVDEKTALNNQVSFLEKQLEQVRSRLKDLEEG